MSSDCHLLGVFASFLSTSALFPTIQHAAAGIPQTALFAFTFMDWFIHLLTAPDSVAHIVLVYSFVIALGMALGRIKVFGVSLGVTFVLFVGLAASYAGVSINPTVMGFMRDFGIILFVFFLGLQVGPSFFSSFKAGGLQLNLLTLLSVFLSILLTVALWFVFRDTVTLPEMLGVHYGAVTNTPGLGATQEALDMLGYQGENIAVGYACAYPLGVVGIITSALILRIVFRVDLKAEDRQWEEDANARNDAPIFFHVRITNRGMNGQKIRAVREFIGRPFICSRVLHDGTITSPTADTAVYEGDVCRIVCSSLSKSAIVAFFGEEDNTIDLATEHSPLTSRVIRVTKESVNGLKVGDLHLSRFDGVNITRIFRSGMTLFPYQNLHLQMGDQVYCVGPERSIGRLADRLGNQVQKLDHPNIISIFLGIALGIFLGFLPISIPGMPVPLKLGLAGGPLIVAILLGYWGPHFKLVTYTTHSANLMLREFGISIFLASVGLSAGDTFVAALVKGNGPLYVALGIIITMVPLLIVGAVARMKFKMNYHSIVGLLAGATTDPPTLAYANTLSEKDSSAIAYSTVYPLAMFLRIITGQLTLLVLWSFIN